MQELLRITIYYWHIVGVTKMPLRIFKHVGMASSHAVEKLEKSSGIHVHVRIVRGSRVFLEHNVDLAELTWTSGKSQKQA